MAGDSTQFLIDMAAKLTGGDASVASLRQLGEKMLSAGATATSLEAAVMKTSKSLEDSSAAVQMASSALRDGEGSYGQAEAAADRAAKAVERLGVAAVAQQGKLAKAMDVGDVRAIGRAQEKLDALTARQVEAAGKAKLVAGALSGEAAALDVLRAKAGAAVAAQDSLTKGLKALKVAANETAKAELAARGTGKSNEIAEAFGKLGGPLGIAGQNAFGLASGFKKMAVGLGSLGPYVAAAAVILAIGTAAVAATIAITKWAVSLADAGRTSTLLSAGIAHSVAGGAELDATIAKLGAVVPYTREELQGMAGDLAKTGLRGKALSNALEDAAVKAAELKWGPDFAKQMTALDVQSKRFGRNLGDVFGGLKIDKLLDGVATLVGLFDTTTASGQALKFLFEALFQPIVDGVAEAIPAVERLFLQAEILALKAYIALKPWGEELKLIGVILMIGVAIPLAIVGAAVGLLVLAFVELIAWIGLIGYAIYKLGELFLWVGTAIVDALAPTLLWIGDLGGKMIDGLVNGITGGATAVVKAITGVVGGAIDAAKHMLGIASPSKVFAGIGDFTAQGFAEGVEGGTDRASGALEAMVAPPSVGGGASGGGGRGPITVNITVEGRGESDDSLASKIRDAVLAIFEGDALSMGGGEAAT